MIDLDLFESLLSCSTVEELHATTTAISKQMGFEHFLYGVQVNTSLVQPYQFILSGYSKQWREHYIEMNYQAVDPTVRHCITNKRVVPITWDDSVFKEPINARFMGEAKEAGLRYGASFAVHGGRGETAMLSLATCRAAREARSDVAVSLAQGQLLATNPGDATPGNTGGNCGGTFSGSLTSGSWSVGAAKSSISLARRFWVRLFRARLMKFTFFRMAITGRAICQHGAVNQGRTST